ncbi:uncharacterized protein [Gossypium hirsutum]|uniref:Retrotransposon gag domain-containing protein n=1 Tax=Gossypium hirsutum TaxID=3635 RepID=A0ABM2YN75_GOSHI|nr:uncharacterized protein LOC121205111 [Gossypium hirsutum]
MNQWYHETIQGRSQAQQLPLPLIVPPVTTPVAHPLTDESSKRTPIEKLRKFRAEEFRGRSDDDPIKAEYWLKSLERVFKQMMCSPEDYLRYAVSLLKEEAYNWWETIEAVVPADKLAWEFFQNEFKKKYVGKRYLDKKNREFLDLQQGNKIVAEYEREFVYLSRYARDVVPTEEEMCIRFEEGLNDEIRMMIGGTEIREFVVLSDRAQKMEEVYNKKMQRERRGKETGEIVSAEFGDKKNDVRIISAFTARKLIRKGNEAFLAYILDTRGSELKMEQLSVVNEFTDVFPEELPSLPPDREVEFTIDAVEQGYYRRFVKNFSMIASPMTRLLHKNVEFVWSDESQQSFDQLKKMLTEAPVLTQPESGKANVIADALSRKSYSFALRAMNAHLALNEEGVVLVELKVKPMFLQQIQKLQNEDPKLVLKR